MDPLFPVERLAAHIRTSTDRLQRKKQQNHGDLDESTKIKPLLNQGGSLISTRSLQKPALAVARQWISTCLLEHTSCKNPAEPVSVWSLGSFNIFTEFARDDGMPRRLLDLEVVASSSSSNDRIKLVDVPVARTRDDIWDYVTLSHRWGQLDGDMTMTKTTKENLERFMNDGISMEELPQLFREVVEVTRGLGYRFLWIDCLCIVQDDLEDWEEEAPRMAVIYGHCVCTIAATCAKNCHDTLFNSNLEWEKRKDLLNSRGWVQQERMLSPRTIAFDDGQIRWECRQSDASDRNQKLVDRTEHHKDGAIDVDITHPKDMFNFFRDFRIEGLSYGRPKPSSWGTAQESISVESWPNYFPFLRRWWMFVQSYTSSSLTFPSDKFLAMNAVASISQRHHDLRNTWGLWKAWLLYELLWSVEKGSIQPRPKEWLAPSWSWSSIGEGKIVHGVWLRNFPMWPRIMTKRDVVPPFNTSFDQTLPIKSFNWQCYGIQLKGDLRDGELKVVNSSDGSKTYGLILEPTKRCSDSEEHLFLPDTIIEESRKVKCLWVAHYDREDTGWDYYLDIKLVIELVGRENYGVQVDDIPDLSDDSDGEHGAEADETDATNDNDQPHDVPRNRREELEAEADRKEGQEEGDAKDEAGQDQDETRANSENQPGRERLETKATDTTERQSTNESSEGAYGSSDQPQGKDITQKSSISEIQQDSKDVRQPDEANNLTENEGGTENVQGGKGSKAKEEKPADRGETDPKSIVVKLIDNRTKRSRLKDGRPEDKDEAEDSDPKGISFTLVSNVYDTDVTQDDLINRVARHMEIEQERAQAELNQHTGTPASFGGPLHTEDRIFRRIGYLETRYREKRDFGFDDEVGLPYSVPENFRWSYVDLR